MGASSQRRVCGALCAIFVAGCCCTAPEPSNRVSRSEHQAAEVIDSPPHDLRGELAGDSADLDDGLLVQNADSPLPSLPAPPGLPVPPTQTNDSSASEPPSQTPVELPPARLWQDATGKFQTLASLRGFEGESVLLTTDDGREITVRIIKLSAEDQEYALDQRIETGPFTGKVVRVIDGDTIVVLIGKRSVKVRLEGIDCPEPGQGFATQAKKATAALCFGKQATVAVTGKDKYDRTLGVVQCEDANVNEELLKAGVAWHYKKYNQDERLASLETDARRARVGIWSEKRYVPPWDWRQMSADQREDWVMERGEFAIVTEPLPEVRARPPPIYEPPTNSHWLNTSSNVRHNRGCRWYATTKRGRYCGPNNGRACGICGG